MISFRLNNSFLTLIKIVLFLILILVIVFSNFSIINNFFLSNRALNSLIIGVFGFVVIYTFLRTIVLISEEEVLLKFYRIFGKIEKNRSTDRELLNELSKHKKRTVSDRILKIIRLTKKGFNIEIQRSLIAAVEEEEENRRVFTKYLINILVFLGLIGTFWGLLITISGVREVIKTLNLPTNGEVSGFVLMLQTGLQKPLAGMAKAFSTSFFGLAATIIAGFFEIQLNQATSKFINKLEEFSIVHIIPYYSKPTNEITLKDIETSSRYIYSSQETLNINIKQISELVQKMSIAWSNVYDHSKDMIKLKKNEINIYNELNLEIKKLNEKITFQNNIQKNEQNIFLKYTDAINIQNKRISEIINEISITRKLSKENILTITKKLNETLSIIITKNDIYKEKDELINTVSKKLNDINSSFEKNELTVTDQTKMIETKINDIIKEFKTEASTIAKTLSFGITDISNKINNKTGSSCEKEEI